VTREFFEDVRAHLRPGGVMVVNVGHVPGSDALEKVVSATLRAVFPTVIRDVVAPGNSLVLATAGPLTSLRAAAVEAGLPSDLRAVASLVADRMGPPLSGGSVYTDDRAPVEWLTDFSIVHYATSGG